MLYCRTSMALLISLVLSLTLLASPFKVYAKTLKKAKYYKQTVKVNGKEREYYVYLPKGINLKKKYPAVVTFHGFESDANGIKWLLQPEKKADAFKYVLIFPNALNKSWNVGKGLGSKNKSADDKAFLATLLNTIPARHPVNKNKIYTMGFSNGAQMAALAYCDFGQQIAATGIVAHSMNIKACSPKYKTPVAIFQGTEDKYVPFGGGGKYNIRSYKDSLNFFVNANNAKTHKDTVVNLKTVSCQRHQNSKKTTKVIGCTLKGTGHSWPGARAFKPEVFGKANTEINTTDFLFKFFQQYTGPGDKKSSGEITQTKQFLAGKTNKHANKNQGKTAKVSSNKGAKKTQPKPKASKVKFEKRLYTRNKKKHAFFITKPLKPSKKPGSIVIVFNGRGYTARNMHEMIEANSFNNGYNFVYVYPQWNVSAKTVTDQFDELFIHQLKAQFPNHANRIFVMGYSDGGAAAQDYYCDYSYVLTAVATANFAWRDRECSPTAHRPILVLQNKKDTKQPYKGNPEAKKLSFRNTIKMLTADINPMIMKNTYIKGKDHRCAAWKDSVEKLTVVECSTDWGGHNLAGSSFKFNKDLGPHMKHFKAPKVIAGFFNNQQHEDFFSFHQR